MARGKKKLSDAAYRELCGRVYKRDGWKCRNPNCGRRTGLHAHHIIYRSQGGEDTTENMVTVCNGCHDLIHGHSMIEKLFVTANSGKKEDKPDANIGLKFITE